MAFTIDGTASASPGDRLTATYTALDDGDAVEATFIYDGPLGRTLSIGWSDSEPGPLTHTTSRTISAEDVSGAYRLRSIVLVDPARNTVTYHRDGTTTRSRGSTGATTHDFDLTTDDFTVQGTTTDTTAPALQSFDITAPSTALPGDQLSASYAVTDDSGAVEVSFSYAGPTGRGLSIGWYASEPGPLINILSTRISARQVAGTYRLQSISISDAARNGVTYHRDGSVTRSRGLTGPAKHSFDLTTDDFAVTGTENTTDTTAPELRAFTIDAPATVSPGDKLTATYTALDDGDAVEATFVFDGPLGRSFSIGWDASEPGPLNNTISRTISAEQISGTYRLASIVLTDPTRNATTYHRDGTVTRSQGLTGPTKHTLDLTGDDFVIQDTATDTTAPQLESFTVHPPRRSLETGDERLLIDYVVADDGPVLSGLSFVFDNESGGTSTATDGFGEWEPLSGRLDPWFRPLTAGRQKLVSIVVIDRAGNTSVYARDGRLWRSTSPEDLSSRHDLDLSAGDHGTDRWNGARDASLELTGNVAPGVYAATSAEDVSVQGQVVSANGDGGGNIRYYNGSRSVNTPVIDGAFTLVIPKRLGTKRFELSYSDGNSTFASAFVHIVRLRATQVPAVDPTPGEPSPMPAPSPLPTPGAGSGAGSGEPAPSAPPATPPAGRNPALTGHVLRLSGADRVSSAIAVSRADHPEGAPAAVLTSATAYADAIGGGRLASSLGSPLLLTSPDGLRADVLTELQRVLPEGGTVYVLGGRGAIGEEVDRQLHDAGLAVRRVQGSDRFETAREVADILIRHQGDRGPIYLANGRDFPDGLAVSALAARTGGVVLLTDGSSMPAATAAYLAEHDPSGGRTTAVGGPAARASKGSGQVVAGSDRYETAALVAERFAAAGGASVVGIARGTSWPDALVGGASMGHRGGPLLLVADDSLDPRSRAAVSTTGAKAGVVYGGTSAVTDAAARDLASAVG